MEGSKVDVSKVTSGYDAELNFTEEFFVSILRDLIEAEEIPDSMSYTIPDKNTTILITHAFKLKFRSVSDESVFADAFFNVKGYTNIGLVPVDFDVTDLSILLEFNFYIMQKNTNKPGELWFEIKFKDFDLASLEKRVNAEDRMGIVQELQKKIYFKGRSGIAGSLISSFAIKGFQETETHQSAVGFYFNYPFIVEANGTIRSSDQENVGNAQCILPSKTHTIAVAINNQIYPMLEEHQKYQFAELQDNGNYRYPVYKNTTMRIDKIGNLKWVRVYPASSLENALYIKAKIDWNIESFTGTAFVTLEIAASFDASRNIQINTKLEPVEINIDPEFYVLDIIFSGFLGFVGSWITGGFFGLAVGGLMGVGLTQSARQIGIPIVEDAVKGILENSLSDKVSPLTTIPNRMTIIKKRWDPFFYEHYQLINTFEQLEISGSGIFATCDGNSNGRMSEPILTIKLAGVTRDVGDRIIDLIYKVPLPEELESIDFNRYPEYLPPIRKHPDSLQDEYMVSIDERMDRISLRLIRSSPVYVTPKQVYLRHNQIKYLKFDTGLVLTPQEAAKLELQSILVVCGGYRRIYNSKYETFYYRSRKNINVLDNLANLPKFEPRKALFPVAEEVIEYD